METQIETLAQQFIDALHSLEQGDDTEAEPLAILFSEDATLTNAALELTGKEVKGRDAILQFWVECKSTLGQALSNFHHITMGDRAAGLFWTTGGQGPDGQPVRYHGATLLEFDQTGLIQFLRGYYDTRELTMRGEADSKAGEGDGA